MSNNLLIWLAVAPIVAFIILYILFNYIISGRKCVCIVVLADIGRSPRMQYHALSFAKEGFAVDLIGYGGSSPLQDLTKNEQVNIYFLPEVPSITTLLPRLLCYATKVIWQTTSLCVTLLLTPKSSHILLQNPPSIPTLAVVWVVAAIRRSKVIIDWHNYGYSILGLTLGHQHPLVKFSKWFEKTFGRFANGNLCVTDAMKKDLHENWKIKAHTVYDRAPDNFKETDLQNKHQLYLELSKFYQVFATSKFPENPAIEKTRFTIKDEDGKLSLLEDRPALLVSSTSWTIDEDFSVLVDALDSYEGFCEEGNELPKLVCVITGKGQLKDYYSKQLDQKPWKHISVCLPWLEAEDYPTLLGCADVGVCLHKSSSGLDLPMKVVDMFGCCLPVCAINFNCLSELVKHSENGLIFKDSNELAENLKELLTDYQNNTLLKKLRCNLKEFQKVRWHHNWKTNVEPLFIETDQSNKKQD
ncbi:chitobiosyldiphosphodolichol beta-mannosyltransferase [Octopus sinensis]|uniref:Chitobiosyldiphosphodolichol beta-mannosyltransferase n=1 Tax=Octopus sinensis TaxID=2607531 RepID=A0A6P7SBT8_9MOLL|nr:chitobiosyldiphosphodolichol beta-mannosyltransferase [Octopus sinensis]XP_036358390.1 chitobiosyldiphosphodolichol beta-mannosyltransferase [Octopus sinensis]XP_036358391.1 chitobiosyldiphosphodolichol beta-mannosyltransferase [Octopus sinensis]XP_036358392.1 chitobiosyldiphosphodolichol beta-mannosyltransferase [Octopus sinensis]